MIDEYLNEAEGVDSYIRHIKNKNKKEYAKRYYKWKKNKEKGDSPDHGALGTMGAQAVRMNIDDLMESIINEAPIAAKGWTMKSIEKFEKTLGKKSDAHGFFDACVKRMESRMGEQAKGFCASIKDSKYGSPMWRGKEKSKKEIKAGVKAVQFTKQLPKGKAKEK